MVNPPKTFNNYEKNIKANFSRYIGNFRFINTGVLYSPDKGNIQLKIMKDDLIDLQKQQSDFSALPIEKLRAKEQVTKLTSLIENYQRSMAKSQTIFC